MEVHRVFCFFSHSSAFVITHANAISQPRMCIFEYKVLLCGCESPTCKQRTSHPLEKSLPTAGHIIRITQVYRVSGICMGWFNNTDPNRIVVRWGFPAENKNSTQDCKDKKFTFNRHLERGRFCDACLWTCEQPESVARLVRSSSLRAVLERQRRGLEVKPELNY